MKKFSIFLCAAAAIATLSCNKEVQDVQEPQGNLHPMTFIATTTETRTVLDDDQVSIKWLSTDKISVFDGQGNREFSSDGEGRKVKFTGEAAEAQNYIAVYPYNAQATRMGFIVRTSLAAFQTPVSGTFADGLNINAAISADKTTFAFENVMSVAKFTLSADKLDGKTIKSVKFSSSYPLAGDVEILVSPDGISASAGDNTVNEVTMTNVNGLADGTYYFVVLPNAGGEISMTFTATDNSSATIDATLTKAFTAGKIKDLGTVKGLTWAAPVWKLVTDASTLSAGDKLVIASNANGAVASDLANNVLTSAENVVFSADKQEITSLPTEAMQFTLGGTTEAWTLTSSGGQLKATAVKKLSFSSGTETWGITIQDNNATIQSTNISYGRFLYNVTTPRFTTYTSDVSANMLLPQLYREEPASGTTPFVKDLESNLAISDNIKKVFKIGETFSFGEGTVTASYSDGETKVLSLADVSVEGFDSSSAIDSQTITISYSENGRTATASYVVSIRSVQTYTVTYTVATTRKVNITSGEAPAGASDTFINSYNTAKQMTGGNYQTLTLSGYNGAIIKGITLSMHSNKTAGSGHFTCKVGTTTIAGFTENITWKTWYNISDWSQDYKDVIVEMTNDNYYIQENENVVLNIYASANSLFNQSFTITYEL